jgi:reductive dehalogenase
MKMVKAAMHAYGSNHVGCVEIDSKTQTLFNANSISFDSGLDAGYRDENRVYHVPSSCKYLVTYVVKQDHIQNSYGRAGDDTPFVSNRPLGGLSSAKAYSYGPQIHYNLMRFIKALGWHAYTPSISGNTAAGVMSGLVEQGRAGFSMHAKYGLMIRYIRFILTDMPVAPTKPIDYGGRNFCKSCKICAEYCPSGSVSMETEPSWEVRDPGNNPGINTWYQGWSLCASGAGGPWDCFECQSLCPFNSLPTAGIHALIRGMVAKTTLFNSFFTQMETTMGFEKRPNDDDWWNRDLATWPHDNLLGFGTAGW